MKKLILPLAALALLNLAACSLPHPKVPELAPEDKTEAAENGEKPLAIATEDSVMKRRNEKGEILLVARSKSSTTSLDLNIPGRGDSHLDGVEGELYRKGVVISRFTAPKGRFIEADKILWLEGGVTVISEEKQITLTAQQIKWRESSGLITAVGSVWLKGETFDSGPAPKLVTTPDLERFGTPDRFD